MKVLFKKNIKSYSGKNDDVVYESCRKGNVCLGRDYVVPKYTTNNQRIGAVAKNLAVVYANAATGYKADLKKYAERNGQENVSRYELIPGMYPLFNKMMYVWAKTDPTHIDLTAVTVADIVTMDAEVMNIERAIDAGYLKKISEYNDLTADIQ